VTSALSAEVRRRDTRPIQQVAWRVSSTTFRTCAGRSVWRGLVVAVWLALSGLPSAAQDQVLENVADEAGIVVAAPPPQRLLAPEEVEGGIVEREARLLDAYEEDVSSRSERTWEAEDAASLGGAPDPDALDGEVTRERELEGIVQ
jgi:hypothetical protein